jgi:two-component system chemotaxis response regulator CheB
VEGDADSKLRVVVIDDSRTYRAVLRHLLEADGDIEVVGEADDGAAGIARVQATKPDLVTMDIDMPRLDGLGAIRRIMAECPVPILVVTGRPSQPSTMLFEALELGALDLIVKPSIVDAEGAILFRAVVRNLAETPVVASRRASVAEPPLESASLERQAPRRRDVKMVGIVGSTGGPRATVAVLRQLGKSIPWPIAIVQHLPAGAEEGYARYLASATTLAVEVARDDVTCEPGKVWLASSAWQLVCTADGLRATQEPNGGLAPSANVLFRSMADVHGEASVAIMLSGSNLDGIEGMRELRAKGALTIVEDETSTLQNFGPRKAVADGVVERVMSAQLIASTLLSLARPQDALSTIPPVG